MYQRLKKEFNIEKKCEAKRIGLTYDSGRACHCEPHSSTIPLLFPNLVRDRTVSCKFGDSGYRDRKRSNRMEGTIFFYGRGVGRWSRPVGERVLGGVYEKTGTGNIIETR